MKWFRRFMNWLVMFLFPRAVKRLAEKHHKDCFHEHMNEWQSKMGGPGKACVNPSTGETYYEYGCSPDTH